MTDQREGEELPLFQPLSVERQDAEDVPRDAPPADPQSVSQLLEDIARNLEANGINEKVAEILRDTLFCESAGGVEITFRRLMGREGNS